MRIVGRTSDGIVQSYLNVDGELSATGGVDNSFLHVQGRKEFFKHKSVSSVRTTVSTTC